MDCVDIYLKIKELDVDKQQQAIFELCQGKQQIIDEVNVFIYVEKQNKAPISNKNNNNWLII